MRKLLLYVLLCGPLLPLASARADDDATVRAQRWQELRHAIFGNRPVQEGRDVLTLQTPYRAEDAALVPVEMVLKRPMAVKGLYLIIDNNPSPLAAHFSFGPDADPHTIGLRVRVNDYTDMHAVAETQDGTPVQRVGVRKGRGRVLCPIRRERGGGAAGYRRDEAARAGDLRAGQAAGCDTADPPSGLQRHADGPVDAAGARRHGSSIRPR